MTSYQAGNVPAGDQAFASALTFQRSGSLWLFQIALADSRYMSGEVSERVGMSLYDTLLRNPAPTDWAGSPLEALSVLAVPHEAVFEHWFELARQEQSRTGAGLRDRRSYATAPFF